MPDNLSLREAAFAAEYVAKRGNGTQAAIAAGYAPSTAHVSASRLIRRDKVKKKIQQLTRKHEISAERVLTRLDNLSAKAEESGNFPAAVRAEELIGKSLGMWIDRSVTVNMDISKQHLDALRALAARRRDKKEGRAGDDAAVIEGQVIDAANNAPTSDNRHYDKQPYNLSENKSVVDQRLTDVEPQSDTAVAQSGTLNVDGDNI